MLYLVGLGFGHPKHLTIEAKNILQTVDTFYIETYTSKLQETANTYKKEIGVEANLLYRPSMEQNMQDVLQQAQQRDVAIGIIGDVFSATTHSALYIEAHNQDIETKVVHNTSIFNAVSATGLQLYLFGKTTSIVYPKGNWLPHSPLHTIHENKERGLHTMCLLDIEVTTENERYMTCQDALDLLLQIQREEPITPLTKDTTVIFTQNLGTAKQKIRVGTVKNPPSINNEALQTLIIPGNMHEAEEEMLKIQTTK